MSKIAKHVWISKKTLIKGNFEILILYENVKKKHAANTTIGTYMLFPLKSSAAIGKTSETIPLGNSVDNKNSKKGGKRKLFVHSHNRHNVLYEYIY